MQLVLNYSGEFFSVLLVILNNKSAVSE